MGRREQEIERGRLQLNLASLLTHGSVKCPIKSHRTLTITVQSATTAGWDHDFRSISVLQRDVEGKSRLFSRYTPVLIPVLSSENNSLFLNVKQNYIAWERAGKGTQRNNSERDWGRVNPKQHLLEIHRHPKPSKRTLSSHKEGKYILCFYWSLMVISWCQYSMRSRCVFLHNCALLIKL